jgi:hypothetical protein
MPQMAVCAESGNPVRSGQAGSHRSDSGNTCLYLSVLPQNAGILDNVIDNQSIHRPNIQYITGT